jgi:hypothetical protein
LVAVVTMLSRTVAALADKVATTVTPRTANAAALTASSLAIPPPRGRIAVLLACLRIGDTRSSMWCQRLLMDPHDPGRRLMMRAIS